MIVAGFGFRAAVTEASLADAFAKADGKGRATDAATAADKATAPAFRAFADGADLHILAIDSQALSAQQTSTQSAASRQARATGSVAEAAALAGAGRGAKLLAQRVISSDGAATCALAEGEGP